MFELAFGNDHNRAISSGEGGVWRGTHCVGLYSWFGFYRCHANIAGEVFARNFLTRRGMEAWFAEAPR
jgi:hypothetical protein